MKLKHSNAPRIKPILAATQSKEAVASRGWVRTRRDFNVIMPESTFLNGKVCKLSFPVLQLPLEPDAPALRRLLLPQGELAQFHDAEEGIRYMAFIELLPGQVRGNHYHKVKEELVYVIRGEVLLSVADIDSKRARRWLFGPETLRSYESVSPMPCAPWSRARQSSFQVRVSIRLIFTSSKRYRGSDSRWWCRNVRS